VSDALIPVHIPEVLFHDVARQAERMGLSVEDWLVSLATENLRYEHVADRFFRRGMEGDPRKVMVDILNATDDHLPMPEDRIE
jgi:hypothetical protein